jgi:hypothetical protein
MARHRKLTQKFAGFPIFKVGTSGDTFPITSPFTTGFTGLDGLSLDLQFAADKTLTARKGPTPVFTRGSTGTFVGSDGLIQSAAVNAARFDHDPLTLACKGLLIEESRTNASRHSGALVIGTGWVNSETTAAVDGVGPDGNNAYTVAETSATTIHTLANTGGVVGIGATSITSGTVYTGSIFIKKETGSVDWIQITLGSAGFGTAQYANFNISTGVAGNFAGLASGTSPRIEDYGNGWYRCSISVTATATTLLSLNTVLAFINNTNGTTRTPSYAGSTSNKVLANLCQFEAGSFPTSYIPTTTASGVRSADVCNITGSDFTGFYNQSEGTISYKASTAQPGNSVVVYSATDGTTSNIIQSSPGSSSFAILRLGSTEVNLNHGTFTTGVAASQASAYKLNDFASSKNGGTVLVDLTGTPPSVSQIGLGSQNVAAGRISGHIAYFRYYKKRLPDAKLQSLTT